MALKNKKLLIRIGIVCLALLFLASAAVLILLNLYEEEPFVVSLGTAGVTQEMFDYYLASYKYEFLIQYKADGLRDMGNSWRSLSSDGVSTWEKRFYDEFSEFLARKIAAAALFDTSYSLNNSSRAEIDQKLQMVIDANGGEKTTNELLARYGCDTEDLRRAITLDYKSAMLFRVLYGSDGSGLPNGLLEETYQKEYARVKTVFIRTKGKLQSDGTNAPMTDKDIEEAERKIETLKAYLEDGMDEKEFLSLQEQFNEDKDGAKNYPNGFYFSKLLGDEAVNAYGTAVIEKSLAMKAGEFALEEGEYGVFLIYRMSNPIGAYAQDSNAVWFKNFVSVVTNREYEKLINTEVGNVKFEEELFFDSQVILTPKNYEVVY